MKNISTRWISLIVSVLFVIAAAAPIVAFAEEAEGVKIVSTTPEDGSTGVTPMGVVMEVEFNTPMDPATLTTASISSEPAAIAAVVPDKTKINKCTVYFSALELDTTYEVMFSKQIKSMSGERLQKTVVEFKTTAQFPQHHQIVNGDMENTEHLNMFELAGATKAVISYQKEEDNTVLKFNPGWAGAGVGQYVYLEPGKTYEMRARVKSTTSQMVRMIMSYVSMAEGASNWWHPIVSKTLPADQWVDFSGTVTIPSDLSYDHDRLMRITAQNKGQVIYLDDIQFFEVGYDVPMPKIAKAEEKSLETYISSEVNEELEQMIGLGIFDADTLEKADSKISRLDAAVFMGRMMGASETAKLPTIFIDLDGVKKRDAAQNMVDMGIMKGYGKYFYPNNNMSVDEALECMVNLLGYKPMAAQMGYSAAAIRLKLNEDVQSKTGAVTYSDFAKIIANALDTDIMVSGSVVKDEKLLWSSLKVKEHKGIVTATEYTDLYGESSAKAGNIIIDGVSYKVTFDTYGLEGKKVEIFTKEIDGEEFVLYMTGMNALNNVLKIDWNDLEDYSDREYTYLDAKDKSKKATLASDKKLIYNGVALNAYTTDDMNVGYGSVVLIDNDDDKSYDIVRIENIDTYVVKAVNQETYTIYDANESKVLDLSTAENIVVEENGQKVRFANILPGTVVSAAKSKDGSFAKLYISNNKLESKVGKINKEGKETIVALYDNIHGGGASITVALHPFYAGTKKAMEDGNAFMGQNVVVATDHMGYAVSIEYGAGDTNWQWGYLVASGYSTEAFNEKMEFRIFGEAGEFIVLACAKKVNVNGTSVEARNVLSAINGGADSFVAQLIRFKKNANGDITQILSISDPEGRMTKVSGSSLTYSSTLRAFGYKVSLKSASIPVFAVPSVIAGAEDNQFARSTASEYLVNEKKYTFDAYSIDENELDAEFLVLKGQAVRNPDSWSIGMVTDIVKSIDEEGEIRWEISAKNTASNYTAAVYPDKIDINNLNGKDKGTGLAVKPGDIIMYQNNANAVVNNMYVLYSRDNKTLYTNSNPSGTGNAAYRVVYGTVKERKGDMIRLLPNGASDEAENYEVYNLALYSRVLAFDSERELPYVGSMSDVFDEDCGDDSVEVVIVSSWGGATLMAVYN